MPAIFSSQNDAVGASAPVDFCKKILDRLAGRLLSKAQVMLAFFVRLVEMAAKAPSGCPALHAKHAGPRLRAKVFLPDSAEERMMRWKTAEDARFFSCLPSAQVERPDE